MPILRGTGACWSVLIWASELGRPDKTGEFDTSVALDLPCHPHLVIGLHITTPTSGPSKHGLSFSMNVATIGNLNMDVPGDASIDRASGSRSRRCQKWRRECSPQSAASGRLDVLSHRLSPATKWIRGDLSAGDDARIGQYCDQRSLGSLDLSFLDPP